MNKLVIKNAVLYEKGFTVFCVFHFFYDSYGFFLKYKMPCLVVALAAPHATIPNLGWEERGRGMLSLLFLC